MHSAASPGRSTSSPTAPVLLFDLDETVLAINSFPVWFRYLAFGHFAGLGLPRRVGITFRTLLTLAQRKALGLSHRETKALLQMLWAEAAPDARAAERLSEKLAAHVRPAMRSLLTAIATNEWDAVLTTAAAEEYALPLARKLGFRHALATRRLFGTDAKENIGEEKCRRTLEYIQVQGWGERKRVFFTDHADDAAMIAQSHLVAWFGDEAEAVRLQLHWPQIAITPMLERNGNELLDWVTGVMADRG